MKIGTGVANRQMLHTRGPGNRLVYIWDLIGDRRGLSNQCGQTDHSIDSVEITVNSYENNNNSDDFPIHTPHTQKINSRCSKNPLLGRGDLK